MKNQRKRGISLIVLVITIIVIIILAAAVILTLTANNPISEANKAKYINDLASFVDELNMYKAKMYAQTSGEFLPSTLNATGEDMSTYITSIKGKTTYLTEFAIIGGELVYTGLDTSIHKDWAAIANISKGTTLPETPTINAPVLATGMTPIKWSGTAVTDTTSSDSSWYNYESKQWANARTVDNSMWVWIPRYEYKIPTTHSSTAQTVAVNFIPTTQTTPTSGYTIHPAFTFGSTELAGIWVAKFEASGTTSAINVVPEVTSLLFVTINDIFTACLSMATNTAKYGWSTTNLDTHLMKNIEWGAVAYLTQSTYGKNAEVWINPDFNMKTGRAGTGASVARTTSTYAYNNATYGVQASTTGNVYGIYDMSGCGAEYVAAYVNNGRSCLRDNGQSLLNAEEKYKDLYIPSVGETQQGNYLNLIDKKGDATYETSTSYIGATSWFGDYSYLPAYNLPIFTRGGYNDGTTNAGLFQFSYSDGSAGGVAFRPVVALGSGV